MHKGGKTDAFEEFGTGSAVSGDLPLFQSMKNGKPFAPLPQSISVLLLLLLLARMRQNNHLNFSR